MEVMRGLPAGSVDAVITDPPYGAKQAAWDSEKPSVCLWDELYRLLKPGGVLYYWGFWGCAEWIICHAKRVGFVPQSRIVWWFRTGRPEKHSYREDTEDMYYFSKGEPEVFNAEEGLEPYEDASNYRRYERAGKHPGTVWIHSRIFHNHPENVGHPTQKPVSLIGKALRISTNEGQTVLDPYMGSGTTGVACMQTGRNFIGIEIDSHYFQIAERRIQDAAAQELLPL